MFITYQPWTTFVERSFTHYGGSISKHMDGRDVSYNGTYGDAFWTSFTDGKATSKHH